MPGVESNYGKMRCKGCGSVFDLSDEEPKLPPCGFCGVLNYERIVVIPVCDFCSDNLPLEGECWTFPCEPFTYPFQIAGGTGEASADDWAACDTCHDLIEDGDLKALAKRSVEKDIERHPEAAKERNVLYAMTRAMHARFMENRTGPPFREEVKPV